MTQQFNAVSSDSAAVREYRARVAQTLITLLKSGDAINGVNWAQLDRMPAWILCSDTALCKLTHQIAVTAIASSLAKSIDGNLLSRISHLVGAGFLKRALSTQSEQSVDIKNIPNELELDVFQAETATMLDHLGASILLSSIESPALALVMARRFSVDYGMVRQDLAMECIKFTETNLQNVRNDLEDESNQPPALVAPALLDSGVNALSNNSSNNLAVA